MSLVKLALVAVLALAHALVEAQQCSLYAAPLVTPDNLFNYQTFPPTTNINRTWTDFVNGALRLAIDEPNGGTVGYAWHPVKERIADGFESTVKFKIPVKSAAGDGFTYFIQNDKTQDLNGGSGDKLGAFGISKSIAIKVDLCVDRPAPCTYQSVSLALVNASLTNIPIANAVKNISYPGLVDGNEHTLVVTYGGKVFGDSARLKVTLDGQQQFDVQVGDLSGPQFFGERFAFFGFTASTSWTETSNIDITAWKTDIVPSDTELLDFQADNPFKFEFGTLAKFTVRRRDSCKNPTGQNDNANVASTLNQQPLTGQDPLDAIKLTGNVTNNMDGTYTITYQLPEQLQATWDLDILVNGVRVEGMPFDSGVVSFKPLPGGSGLPIWALILLLLLILLIILVLSYVVYRLYRYRKKLQKNAEFIEAGKKQAELDRLEDGVSYSANRMVGTIDDLKSQLSKNEEELERLRRRGALGEDQNFTIEQLQKQRDNLLEEMNRLKREEQEEELKRSKATENFQAGGRAKKEFGREQI